MQGNDSILEENNVVITEKSAVAELFNNHFIQLQQCCYGQDIKNHPSIIAIYRHYREKLLTLGESCKCYRDI